MITCRSCGQENPPGFNFCGACGALLTEESPMPREERKVVTALFCDLVGSTARAERLDPEDVRLALSHVHERVRYELERFGGTVEKFIGDAVMALFGAPLAREDDPERAVRAALAILEWTQEGDARVRIGITTGEALVALSARPAAGEGIASGASGRSTALAVSASRSSSHSSGFPASARAGSSGSCSDVSRRSRSSRTGGRGAHCPTARASATGRSERW
ncbi:MAG: hypothetical protein H0V50_07180 [Thermoleophilaceae bacterium]|nr:hypothetical protein [Thermoleophilaceae bacterium]